MLLLMQFLACAFGQSLGHQINNCPYWSNIILPTHIILMDHGLYLVSLLIQNPKMNIQNLVYPLVVPNVVYREPIIPFIKNVMQQNPVGFPNLMYPHVGPYTPYFGSSYGGIGSVPTMLLPMFDPLVNPMASPKPVLKIAQTKIVKNCEEPLDEDEDYSKEKHNPKMPQIVPIKKLYHDQKEKPSLIEDVSKPLTSGRIVLISNGARRWW